MLARGKVDQPVDATPDPESPPARHMVNEELRRVACLGRLLRREEPFLRGGDLIQPVPVGMAWWFRRHARNVSITLGLCNPNLDLPAS